MKTKATLLLIFLVVAVGAGYATWHSAHDRPAAVTPQPPAAPVTRSPLPARSAATVETTHYTIASTASPAQTALVADAAESLHDAYTTLFGDSLEIDADRPRLKLVLYQDQREFKANNRTSPWAEAFYLAPYCHAYYADGPNPYHWSTRRSTSSTTRSPDCTWSPGWRKAWRPTSAPAGSTTGS